MASLKSGFSLVELIIAIAILAILATVAAPRLVNLGTDARVSVIKVLANSVKTAANSANIRARIENKLDCDTDPTIQMANQTITMRCGYPCPHPSGITKLVTEGSSLTWVGGNCAGELGAIEVRLDDAPDSATCKVHYTAARSTQPPSIIVETSGC